MTEFNMERNLALFYPLVVLFSLISSITFAVAWNHWKYVLDTCVETNCGCIFNGRSTPTYFTGGHVAYCHFFTYGPLLAIIFALIFGSYHVFRVCMSKGKTRTGTTTVKQSRSGDVIVMTTRTELTDDSVSPYWWIPASITSCFMLLISLILAIMATDGFVSSCKQYRLELTKYMRATGKLVEAIQGRISCAAVFDFMDYLHPDVSFERRREDKINTSAALIIGIIMSWLCVLLWIAISVINIKQAKESRRVRV